MAEARGSLVTADPDPTAPCPSPPNVSELDQPSAAPSLVDRLRGPYRATNRFLGRHALSRATLALPRTLRFVGSTLARGRGTDTLPVPTLSLGLAAHVAMDEAVLAMAMTPNRFPHRADYTRVGQELATARTRFSRRGYLNDPARYHLEPPALTENQIRRRRGWALGIAYEQLIWESGYTRHRGEPGGDRWEAYTPNHKAVATLVRHEDREPRPWLVGVHGFCMGYPFMDFQGLHVAKLHRQLGLNVAMPVLPLHGPRKVTPVSGEPLLSFDLMNAVHGLSQAVWDIRRLIGWIRTQGATSIGLYGISLGGYVVSLLAGIEEGVDVVVAGVPVVDFPALFHAHSPRHIQARAVEHHILGGVAEDVYRVVSPLRFPALVPHDRRFIFAGHADRLATPAQAQQLWEHWDRPSISWYPGNHVGYLWSRQVADYLVDSLRSAGLTAPPPPAGD